MNISLTDLRQAERECLARLAKKEKDLKDTCDADRVVLRLIQMEIDRCYLYQYQVKVTREWIVT